MIEFTDYNVRYWNGDLFISCKEFSGSVGISGKGFQTNGQNEERIIEIAEKMLPLFCELSKVVSE